ncbi:MAG: GYF domain-containing protein [Myxococcota bacterium]|nr:GYF domain-containing protein [Myxococcota bacterium]
MWYVLINDDQLGPMSESELRDLISNGVADSDALVWSESMTDWVPLRESPLAAEYGGAIEPQPDQADDDGTLVASPDDEALKAELAALFEQSQASASIGDRATALDGEQALTDEDEPATIAMPSFVPGADFLDAISPPKADELSMTLGVSQSSDSSESTVQPALNQPIDSERLDARQSAADKSEYDPPADDVDYADIDESLLRQAQSAAVDREPASASEIRLTDDPIEVEGPSQDVEPAPAIQLPQAKIVERETAIQESREQALSSPIADLEPAAPAAIHDARKIGRLESGRKSKVPLVIGVLLLAVVGVLTALYVSQTEGDVVQPKPRPKAIKIGMSSDDIMKLTQAKKKAMDSAQSKGALKTDAPANQAVDSGSAQGSGTGQAGKQVAESSPPAPKPNAGLSKKTIGSVTGTTKLEKKQTGKRTASPTDKKTANEARKKALQLSRAAQREKRKQQASKSKKVTQPKKQLAKSNLFGGTGPKSKLPFSLNHKQITRALGKRRGTLKRCIGKEEKFKNAKVMIALTIKRDGRPANVRAISGSVRGTKIGQCIERAIAGVRFPRFSGDHMQLTVPIRL